MKMRLITVLKFYLYNYIYNEQKFSSNKKSFKTGNLFLSDLFPYIFTALQHIFGHFGRGQLT